ncbi:MAG: AsmA family protein, partial [Planctomycetota bacterium]
MRPRRWVIVLCLIVAALGVTVYQGIRFVEKKLSIERVLIDRISPAIDGEFDVGKVGFGFFSVYLRDVRLSLPLNGFAIEVQDIKVGLSFRKLLTTRGNLEKSISKIIFVKPRFSIMARRERTAEPSGGTPQGRRFSIAEFPVEYLLIEDGTVRLVEPEGYEVILGEYLNGRLHEESGALKFELKGKLASKRKNLSLSGTVSTEGGRNRLSLRLDKARVTKPLRFQHWRITGGTLDGVCEFTFSGDPARADLDSRGWVHVEGGTALVHGVGQPLTDFTLKVSMDGSLWKLDKLGARWSGLSLRGDGAWGVGGNDTSKIVVFCEGIDVEKIVPDISSAITKHVY